MAQSAAQVFKQATDKLRKRLDETCQKALETTLRNAMQDALKSHDAKHQQHIEVGDNYGWMVCKDGQLVSYDVYATSDNRGTAREQLNELLTEMPSSGWSGMLVAGMKDHIHGTFYVVSYEKKILFGTIDFVKKDFTAQFKGKWQITAST